MENYTLVFAKIINNKDVIKFNKMTVFLKTFFNFEIRTRIQKDNNKNNDKHNENNNEHNQLNSINNENKTLNKIDNNIETKLNNYGIPSNLKSGLLNYEPNYEDMYEENNDNIKKKILNYLFTNIILENLNKNFDKLSKDSIMIIKTNEYQNIVNNITNIENNNLLKLPKIDNNSSILGLNNILTFKINEKLFELNKKNVVNQLINLLKQNKLITIK
jgi:hypothetical protein